jgi:AraC-like DNA-binding protein
MAPSRAATNRRPRVTVAAHASEIGRWELARAQPAPALRLFVREYVGWFEALPQPLARRQLPSDTAPLVFNFGTPFRLFAPGTSGNPVARTSFVTGAFDTYQVVESSGSSYGVQINFTLLGMRRLSGRPLEDMTNLAVTPEDVFGLFAAELAGRLHDASSWESRFDMLDHALVARLGETADVPDAVQVAWAEIQGSAGRVSIGRLAQDTGWSHRHFTSRFRHELGITPKVFARILRFDRFVQSARQGRITNVADAALACDYFDQSHLHRDAREFAGTTPADLVKSLIPDDGGFSV